MLLLAVAVLCLCRYLLEQLHVCNPIVTCFSNRLLKRLYKADHGSAEALMGLAFHWEAELNRRLTAPGSTWVPSYDFFFSGFLANCRLMEMFTKGSNVVVLDEVYTLHPLLVDCLLRLLDSFHITCLFAGDPLQVRQKVDKQHLEHVTNRGATQWLWDVAFKMPQWQRLHGDGRIMYLYLSTQHRFDAGESALMREVSNVTTR